jgi:hypothetical protein
LALVKDFHPNPSQPCRHNHGRHGSSMPMLPQYRMPLLRTPIALNLRQPQYPLLLLSQQPQP